MNRWTKEETVVLKQNMDTTLTELKALLPQRNEDQMIERLQKGWKA